MLVGYLSVIMKIGLERLFFCIQISLLDSLIFIPPGLQKTGTRSVGHGRIREKGRYIILDEN